MNTDEWHCGKYTYQYIFNNFSFKLAHISPVSTEQYSLIRHGTVRNYLHFHCQKGTDKNEED